MQTKCEFKGNAFSIELLVLDDDSCPVGDFLASLDAQERRKVDVLFERLGTYGLISNKEMFKKLEGTELFEFKRHQIRLLAFFVKGKRVIVCHGLKKKKDKHKKTDLDHAERLRKSFLGQDG